jgi:hypothetical protein
MRQNIVVLLCACLGGVAISGAGCTRYRHITGEPLLYAVDPSTGELTDRDVMSRADGTQLGEVPHEGEIIAIKLDSVFIRHLETLLRSHVLVYTEVYDEGSNDPAKAVTTVLFNQDNQPSGVHLALADRYLYGPSPFKGHPIRIKVVIVQLAKEQKETVSKVLNAAGQVASTAQPAAAPAVGLVVQALQMLNALTEDDFELRADFVLSPVGSIVKYDIADTVLESEKEPTARYGRKIALGASLRIGPYVILKRELPGRFSGGPDEGDVISTLEFDYAQQGFIGSYAPANAHNVGEKIHIQELLRLHGGYLYRIVRDYVGEDGQSLGIKSATVRPKFGPNAGQQVATFRGYRQFFTDRTYVALTVLNGLPRKVDETSARESSDRDLAEVNVLLENPRRLAFHERIGPQVDQFTAAVRTVIERRQIAEAAARRTGRDPSFRTSTQYPAYWASQIRSLKGLTQDSTPYTNAVATNASILPALEDLVINFPVGLHAYDVERMEAVRALNKDSFEPAMDADGKERKGVFRLTRAAEQPLSGAGTTAATSTPASKPATIPATPATTRSAGGET